MKRCVIGASLACAALLLASEHAQAHGGAPSALGIVAADAEGHPSLVLLNEGLAVQRAGRFSYVCPRLWGDADTSSNKTPLARSINGFESFIVGADDLYVARDGVLTAMGRPESSSSAIVALAGDDESLLGLRLDDAGSAIARIDGADSDVLFKSSDFWSSLAIDDGRVQLARVIDSDELVRLVLDRQGHIEQEFRTAIAGVQPQVSLRPAGERMFAVLSGTEHYTLGELVAERWSPLIHATGPIAGPQASAGGVLWIAQDGELMREESGGFERADEAQRITCLGAWHSLAYACVGSDIYRLTDDGLGERLFHLEAFEGPDPEIVPAAAQRECEYQWLLFKNDLERTGYMPRDFVPSDAGVSSADAGAASADAGVIDARATARAPAGTGCSAVALPAASSVRAVWAVVCASFALLGLRNGARRRRAVRCAAPDAPATPQLR